MSYSISWCLGVFRKHELRRKHAFDLLANRFYCTRSSPVVQFKTFEDMIAFRRCQAKRSALIGINSERSIENVIKICERHGNLTKKVVFHAGQASKHQLACLVEYSSVEELNALLGSCSYSDTSDTFPIFSRILKFSSNEGKKSLTDLETEGLVEYHVAKRHNLSNVSGSKQFELLYENCRLTDLGSRLRFLICMQLEDSLSGMFPHCKFLPFGSSVNGFGCRDSDLDVYLSLDTTPSQNGSQGLTFHQSFRRIENSRTRTQLTLDVLGDMMKNFLPCVSSMQRILQARVPILKFHHNITGIDSDISFSNGTGYHMSELLFLFGELDPRVRLLVFAIRSWSKFNQLAKDSKGLGISNFTVTLMVIFFLQRRNPPILPTVQQLKQMAGPEDHCVSDGVDFTFKRTFAEIQRTKNSEDIGSLVCDFFHFCNEMNWEQNGISIFTGEVMGNLDSKEIYIQNPLEHDLNVSKNIRRKDAIQFKLCVVAMLQEVEQHLRNQKSFSFLVKEEVDKTLPYSSKGLNVSHLFEKRAKPTNSFQDNADDPEPDKEHYAKKSSVLKHVDIVKLFDQSNRQPITHPVTQKMRLEKDSKQSKRNLQKRRKDPIKEIDLWKIL